MNMPNFHMHAILTVPKTHQEVLDVTHILARNALDAAQLTMPYELETRVVPEDLGVCILEVTEISFRAEGVDKFHRLATHNVSYKSA